MLIYKVYLDMTLVINNLQPYKLGKYNATFPIVFIEARNPDEACFKAAYNLIKILLEQEDTVETRLVCRKVRRYLRVMKVECQ
jgi:hypothetical protein